MQSAPETLSGGSLSQKHRTTPFQDGQLGGAAGVSPGETGETGVGYKPSRHVVRLAVRCCQGRQLVTCTATPCDLWWAHIPTRSRSALYRFAEPGFRIVSRRSDVNDLRLPYLFNSLFCSSSRSTAGTGPDRPHQCRDDSMADLQLTSDQLRQRVISNTGSDGRLKNDEFELDARTVAILSKRHQISVSLGKYPSVQGAALTRRIAKLRLYLHAEFLHDGPCLLGGICCVSMRYA